MKQFLTPKLNNMNKSIQNSGARYVKKMIENKESLKSIEAFCSGYGFDIHSYTSPVTYIKELSRLCITIRRKTYYYYI